MNRTDSIPDGAAQAFELYRSEVTDVQDLLSAVELTLQNDDTTEGLAARTVARVAGLKLQATLTMAERIEAVLSEVERFWGCSLFTLEEAFRPAFENAEADAWRERMRDCLESLGVQAAA